MPELLKGYFVGVNEYHNAGDPERVKTLCNSTIDMIWGLNPSLAYNVMLPSGDFLRSFERTIEAVIAKLLPAAALRPFAAWNGPRQTTTEEARTAAEILLVEARQGDQQAAAIGIDFIQFALTRQEASSSSRFLMQMFSDNRLDTVFGLLEESINNRNQIPHWFQHLFQLALASNTERAVDLVISMLAHGSYEASEAASGLMHSLAVVDSSKLMEKLGSALLDGQGSTNLAFRKVAISVIPNDIVISWLEKHGLEGARALARHTVGPYVSTDGPELNEVTRFIMETYGDDEQVFSAFVAATHRGGVFAGPISNWMQRGVTLAEQFVNFPIPSVRRWARSEVEFGSKQVEEFREREEEGY
jgi:hypothetical protein